MQLLLVTVKQFINGLVSLYYSHQLQSMESGFNIQFCLQYFIIELRKKRTCYTFFNKLFLILAQTHFIKQLYYLNKKDNTEVVIAVNKFWFVFVPVQWTSLSAAFFCMEAVAHQLQFKQKCMRWYYTVDARMTYSFCKMHKNYNSCKPKIPLLY